MQPLPRIPGYELLTCLGGSLLTTVYAARERSSDAPCAVKVLNRDWQDDATAVKLLQREARACMAVQHPHLVKLLAAHVTRPPFYLVMEMLGGESLRRRLRRDYKLDELARILSERGLAISPATLRGYLRRNRRSRGRQEGKAGGDPGGSTTPSPTQTGGGQRVSSAPPWRVIAVAGERSTRRANGLGIRRTPRSR